jgi:hypothetical protein
MSKIPKYGTHNGIKYSPRRTLFRLCIICGRPFFDIPPRSKRQVCSEECDKTRKNTVYNFKNNPINNANKIYQPPKDEQERITRNNKWKTWYNNTTEEYKAKYNKRKNRRKNLEPQVSSDAELDALYAELGLTRR